MRRYRSPDPFAFQPFRRDAVRGIHFPPYRNACVNWAHIRNEYMRQHSRAACKLQMPRYCDALALYVLVSMCSDIAHNASQHKLFGKVQTEGQNNHSIQWQQLARGRIAYSWEVRATIQLQSTEKPCHRALCMCDATEARPPANKQGRDATDQKKKRRKHSLSRAQSHTHTHILEHTLKINK